MTGLKLEHIYKIYNTNAMVVKDLNLDIKDKEFIVFVGPSGCGKSTILRMIAGLEEISKGDLYIDGKKVNNVPSRERDIAMVFQSYALYPHLSVYENMAFGLKMRKVSKDEIDRRVREAADILGLLPNLNQKPDSLSGGQRQRVAIGRAIVRDAKVFLMDEPLSNLDAKLRVQMRTEIIKLHKRLQTTTIYVTHDQTEAMTMATRIVVMKDGIIQQVGSPKEVYHSPENVFVGGFIGSPGMNFFHGTLKKQGFSIGSVMLAIPEEKMKVLRDHGYIGRPIILGIRPEDIHSGSEYIDTLKGTTICTRVDVNEQTGADLLIYSSIEDQSFVARLFSNHHVKAGAKMDLAFNTSKAHFFDTETKIRIK